MKVVDCLQLHEELVGFVERGSDWMLLLDTPGPVYRPVYGLLRAVSERNPADLLMSFPVPFSSPEQFAEGCLAVALRYLQQLVGFTAEVPEHTGCPVTVLNRLAHDVQAQMPQSPDRRLTFALIPPEIADTTKWENLAAQLTPQLCAGAPAFGWIVRVTEGALASTAAPGVLSLGVTLPTRVAKTPKTAEERVMYGLLAAKQALAQKDYKRALAWCGGLERHPLVQQRAALLSQVLMCEGDALRHTDWKAAHRRYQLAFAAASSCPQGGYLSGVAMSSLAVSGKIVNDPLTSMYVQNAKAFQQWSRGGDESNGG